MITDRDANSVAPEARADGAAAPSAPVEAWVGPTSFAAIEAEGARERWLLARSTARSVFTDPALVTPRRMALLGEQGLATFVDEVRAAARYLIRREREKRAADAYPEEPASDEATGDHSTEPKLGTTATRRRRPAAFQAPTPGPQFAILRTLVARLRPGAGLQRFLGDALFWSVLPAVILVSVVLAYRFAFILLR